MVKVLEYLKYASTWKGLVAVAAAFGITFTDAQADAVVAAALAVIGAIQIFIDDRVK